MEKGLIGIGSAGGAGWTKPAGGIRRPVIAAAAAAAVSLTACGSQNPGQSPPRLLGVVAANVSTFTSTPDGCAISVIFDDAKVGWNPGETPAKGAAAKAQKRWLAIAVPPSAAGAALQVDVRGSYAAAGTDAPPTATLAIAGARTAIALPDGQGNNEFTRRVTGRIPSGASDVSVVIETAAPKPKDPAGQAMLTIDTLDLLLLSKPQCGKAPK
jgi:hypothetical protein